MTQPQSDESSDEEDADEYCEDNPKTDNTGLGIYSTFFACSLKYTIDKRPLDSCACPNNGRGSTK